jgi:hypothetical protein
MTWKNIRLELARTKEFPQGSASRAYLLRLPLDDDGLINETELRALPARATVRRFWPNEPDMAGYVIRTPRGWAFSYRVGEEDDEAIFHLETHHLCTGEYITLTEPDGRQFPFRVASVDPIGELVATAKTRAA